MNGIPNGNLLLRMIGMLVLCFVLPPLLFYYIGAFAGLVGSSLVAAYWYHQYRFPRYKADIDHSFWFVVGGYAIIGFTFLVCLVRIVGFSLVQ